MARLTPGNRVVGLSNQVRAPSLLSTFRTRSKEDEPAALAEKKTQVDVDVYAPPLSSDEEEEDVTEPPRTAEKKREWIDDESDGDESPDRADIQPTFSRESRHLAQRRTSKMTTYSSSRPADRLGRYSTGLERVPGSQPPRIKAARDFGKKRPSPDATRPATGPKRRRKAADEPVEPAPMPTLKLPDDTDDESDGPFRASKDVNFKIPGTVDSPSPQKSRHTLRHTTRSPSLPAPAAKLNLSAFDSSDDTDGQTSGSGRPPRRGTTKLAERKKRKKSPAAKIGSPEPPSTQLQNSFLSDDDDSPLSDIESVSSGSGREEPAAKCPYCNKPVDAALLALRTKGAAYMPISRQRAFCTEHKKAEARAVWSAKGYPEIDWKGLDSRISSHHEHIEKVLGGTRRSYFADALARDVKAGTKRNLMKADFEGSNPGYYGTRGFRAMQEGIFSRFSDLLRKRAVEDGLVAARGYSLYVQAVLVPELAVRLVMEDMRVGEEEARRIMGESARIGELLCEDLGDVVEEGEEDIF